MHRIQLRTVFICGLVIEKMRLEVEPVRRDVTAERTLVTVAGRVTTSVHVEERTVAKYRTACAHKNHLTLAQVGQYLLVGEVRQQVHQMGVRINVAASFSVGHLHQRRLSLNT